MLVVGDLHYDLRQFDWVLERASDADIDVVVIVGDLLDINSTVPIDVQVPVVLGYLKRLGARTTTVVCSGNHDLTGRDAVGEKAAMWLGDPELGITADGDSIDLGRDRVTVCPWWDGPHGRARVDALLASEAEVSRSGGRWIWIYHWPPPDLPVSWIGHRTYGDADLGGWIDRYRPALVLAGHVHQAPFVEGGSWIARQGDTWIVNAGRQIGPIPSHALVDLDQWQAHWWSFEDEGEQAL
jgi:Icc-related predicted phosphoesterase